VSADVPLSRSSVDEGFASGIESAGKSAISPA
jgi:hypothetical protein